MNARSIRRAEHKQSKVAAANSNGRCDMHMPTLANNGHDMPKRCRAIKRQANRVLSNSVQTKPLFDWQRACIVDVVKIIDVEEY